jgi:hypothetical protein
MYSTLWDGVNDLLGKSGAPRLALYLEPMSLAMSLAMSITALGT